MAISHANCSHDRTPAGRAACRKQAAEFDAAVGKESPTGRVRHHKAPPLQGVPMGTKRRAKAVSGQLKPPGTLLRAVHDLADVPHVFSRPIKAAWDNGWHVRVGEPYNDRERRIELLAPYGVVSLVWRDANPNGVHGVFWRPLGSSVTHRIDNVNQSIRLGAGKETL